MRRCTSFICSAFILSMSVVAIAETPPLTDAGSAQVGEAVNHLTMNQWVRLSDNGTLSGRAFLPKAGGQSIGLEDVSVAVVSRDGKVLQAKTDDQGRFKISNVNSGVYALTARGNDVFACCAMHVVDSEQATKLEFPATADIAMANVDFTVVNTAMIRYLPPTVKSQDFKFSKLNFDGLKDQVCGQDLFRVAQSDKGMKGRLHVAGAVADELSNAGLTNVFLFKDAMEIDRTLSGETGVFEFETVEPGFYSILAIGPSGLGLIGFELVDPAELETTATTNVGADGTQLVGFGHHQNQCCGCCPEFAMQVAPMPQVCSIVQETIVEQPMIVENACGCGQEIVSGEVIQGEVIQGEIIEGEVLGGEVIMDGFGTPIAGGGFAPGYGGGFGGGGGFSGGGGFGGGGGGFGGGLGGLAALAPLAILPALIDDDNDPFQAEPQ